MTEISQYMSAWQLRNYGGIDSLEFVTNLPIPKIKFANEVLVEVKAASLNYLDIRMADGYGRVLLEKLANSSLPLILGRDFAGVVKAVGDKVTDLKPGDEVMGVTPPLNGTGSHVQYVVVDSSLVVTKPTNLTMVEAASIPYAGLTAWAGLRGSGGLSEVSVNKKVLVMGATGGVGSIAAQLCKLWGSQVVSTCSTDAVPLIKSLGLDDVIDYRSPDADAQLEQRGGFDVILDCTGRSENYDYTLLKSWSHAKYLTLAPPIMENFNDYGLILGLLKTVYDLIIANILIIFTLKTLRWVLFKPNLSALMKLRDYAQNEQLKPLIDSVYIFDKLPEAFKKFKDGHSRGKIVIQIP